MKLIISLSISQKKTLFNYIFICLIDKESSPNDLKTTCATVPWLPSAMEIGE
jgi:hypothetical protein